VADLLLAVAAAVGLGLLVVALLVATTVAPFVAAVSRAQRRGASTARAGAVVLCVCALAVAAVALLVRRTDLALPVTGLVLLAGWAVPPLVGRLPGLGRRGAHEPG
jgi:hypothetical protein